MARPGGRGGQRRRGKYETPLSEPDGAQRLFAASNALQPDMKANATIIIFHFANHPLILTCSSTRVSARIFQIPPPTTLRSEAYREEVPQAVFFHCHTIDMGTRFSVDHGIWLGLSQWEERGKRADGAGRVSFHQLSSKAVHIQRRNPQIF